MFSAVSESRVYLDTAFLFQRISPLPFIGTALYAKCMNTFGEERACVSFLAMSTAASRGASTFLDLTEMQCFGESRAIPQSCVGVGVKGTCSVHMCAVLRGNRHGATECGRALYNGTRDFRGSRPKVFPR